ncbi:MAG: Gfo/Idh/MocA family oxidoreductase [Planctomycetia bacterium]|nr:Gfo/Idh/MocA family oxidoreductase [Planctomycetia bacterium]
MRKIKYALIGFGGIAENRIAKEGFACDRNRFAPLEKAELIGAFDLNPARKAAAEALGLKWYSGIDKILADPEAEAVYIATNNLSHAPLAMEAMSAGKHVLVEKPLAATVSEAAALVQAAKEKKRSLSVDHMMVNNKLNVKAKELLDAGTLGTVNDSCFHMEFAYGYDPAEAGTWRCSKWEEMGGPIGDVASHCFYMAEYLFGKKIREVAAVYLPKTMPIAVEDGAYIRFKMEDGMCGSVKVAFSELRGGLGGTLSNLGFEIYGTEAVLRSFGTMFQLSGYEDEPIPMRLELDLFKSQKVFTGKDIPTRNIYQQVIEHHAESILSEKYLDGDEGSRNVRICYAAHESARNAGKWIAVE